MKIALVSLDQKWRDKQTNLDLCDGYLAKIGYQGCDIVIFPEMTLTGFYVDESSEAEFEKNSWTIQQFQLLARRYHTGIIFGVALKDNDGLCFNTLITLNHEGAIISRYNKVHPFTFVGENKIHASGAKPVITVFKSAKILNSICYDLRFPELFSSASRDINSIVNIANWPEQRVEQWYALNRARAIEGLVYMIAVNRTGMDDNGLSYCKSSVIFSPTGEKILPIINNGFLDIFELDIDAVAKYRENFPFLHDRKEGLYKSWL